MTRVRSERCGRSRCVTEQARAGRGRVSLATIESLDLATGNSPFRAPSAVGRRGEKRPENRYNRSHNGRAGGGEGLSAKDNFAACDGEGLGSGSPRVYTALRVSLISRKGMPN
jgi:hypothetical protein